MSTTGFRYHAVNSASSSRGSRNSGGSNCSGAGVGVGGGTGSGSTVGGGAGSAAGGGNPPLPYLACWVGCSLKSSGRPGATAVMLLIPAGSYIQSDRPLLSQLSNFALNDRRVRERVPLSGFAARPSAVPYGTAIRCRWCRDSRGCRRGRGYRCCPGGGRRRRRRPRRRHRQQPRRRLRRGPH